MSSITPHYRTIKELLQSRSFSIDEYQREYKWESKNIDELVSDLLEKFEASYLLPMSTSHSSAPSLRLKTCRSTPMSASARASRKNAARWS